MALFAKKKMQFASRSNNHRYGEPSFWLKRDEVVDAKSRLLTVILRLGDRSDPEKMPNQWLPTHLPIPLYFITVPGDQANGILPKFEKDDGTTVIIRELKVKHLSDIVEGDLYYEGGSAVPIDVALVPMFLNEMFSPSAQISGDRMVTLFYVEYVEKQVPANDPMPV